MSVRPVRLILPLAVCAALLVGCGDDSDPQADPTSTASQSASDSPSSDAPATDGAPSSDVPSADPSETTDPDDDPLGTETGGATEPVPADAEELCDVFITAYQGFTEQSGSLSDDKSQPLTPEFVDILHTWGQGVADSELPSDLGEDERAGFGLMSRVLLAVPDDATVKDLDALDEALSEDENDKVEAAGDWVQATCNLEVS